MTEEPTPALPTWERPYFAPGDGEAFLFFVAFGDIDVSGPLSASTYRCAGVPDGIDVSGLTMAVSAHIPKNILIPKSWKAVVFVDERATAEQEGVLLQLFTGQLGGAVADLAGLIGEVVAVERVPITFTVADGKGRISIGKIVEADMAPFVGATGNPTTLAETVFSTIPGSPVYASKASQYTRDGSAHGIPSVDLQGHNALQGHFRFAA